ncbi:hypothetical protein [Salinigranum salinum]|uniref:hypothetical protein n=1 Tax=Salinigranum salinum TaxID=1364937 RepID=UPI0012607C99|nr:hypothetical protein [Salinigranum salinum]
MTTGVTDFIKIGEVRQEIDSTYPNPGEDAEGKLKVVNNGYGHQLVGNAFEYLCRLLLYRRCNEIIHGSWSTFGNFEPRWTNGETPPLNVMRFDGMKWEEYDDISSQEEWDEKQNNLPVWKRQRSSVKWTEDEQLTKLVKQYIQTGMNTRKVVRASLINAGWKPDKSVQSWINRKAFAEDILNEMEELFELLRETEWTNGNTMIEQPGFGGHRYILPGEGDFIVDDLLVDIKTTEGRTFTNQFWRQLLMYYVLCDVQRILYEEMYADSEDVAKIKYPEISKVGIYFARYGELRTVNMGDVIQDQDRYEEFRAWIVDRGIEENRHAQKNYNMEREALTEPYDYKRQQTFSDF